MKQGSGNSRPGDAKVEPRARAVSVDKAANIGVQIVRTQPPTKSLHTGRGYSAPRNKSESTSNRGSQGKY